jgi:hypothetical protein
LRYAGEQIRADGSSGTVVAAFDGRVAYYADARFAMLPSSPVADLCGWLRNNHAGYLLVTDHEERPLRLDSQTGCVKLVQRYPRHRDSYYDLFAIAPEH